MTSDKRLLAAPLQGFTDSTYCRAHADIFGGVDEYFTPFIRVEKGEVRPRDLRDLERCDAGVTPQLIFRDCGELKILLDAMERMGRQRVDLNLGCPFPPQVKAGRGAALVGCPDLIGQTLPLLAGFEVSVKMRLGVESPDEWRGMMPVLEKMHPVHVTLHPRVAREQYGGVPHMDQFAEFLREAAFPVIYNGDVCTPAGISRLLESYPQIAGVMAGRGLLARPSLFAEWRSGEEWSREKQLAAVRRLHDAILDDYRRRLCGDAQILAKIQPFWTYLEPLIGRKAFKALTKTRSLKAYLGFRF